MNATIPWQTLLVLVLMISEAATDDFAFDFFEECPITRCSAAAPEIRYPFRRADEDRPLFCGVKGFDLTCNGGMTILNLPYEGNFFVQSIDYQTQSLQIGDPDGCLSNRTIVPFNLSSSRFRRDESRMTNFSLFDCGSTNASTMERMGYSDYLNVDYPPFPNLLLIPDRMSYIFFHIECRSTSESHIYAARSNDTLNAQPPSCEKLEKTVTLDVADTIVVEKNLLDNTKNLLKLMWELPFCRQCEKRGQMCGLNLTVTTNTTACLHYNDKGGLTSAAIIGIVVTIIFSAILAVAFYYWDHKFGGYWVVDQFDVEEFLERYESRNPKRYSYSDVKRMTNHFHHKLGQGGFGSVYEGRLANGIPVAVKVIETFKCNGDEFINEVATIGRVHHVNVVRLLGFCAEHYRRALIYEFMPNGSLEKFIFSSESKPCDLGWDRLHEIAVGVARGIEYLHQGCDQRILHFDIKPHNILLDHEFKPKISDFGLAKFCSKDQSIVSMTVARGTAGYIAPELLCRNFGNISYKSDVYSFGMLLLEMVGKRKNVDTNVEHTSQVYFPEWIYNRMNTQQELEVGLAISEKDDEIARKLVIVSLWCIQPNPVARPNMKKVVQMLEGETEMLEMPQNPFVSA